jgi:hypothetical protein
MKINSKTGTLFERIIRISDIFMVDCFGRVKLTRQTLPFDANDPGNKYKYIQNT